MINMKQDNCLTEDRTSLVLPLIAIHSIHYVHYAPKREQFFLNYHLKRTLQLILCPSFYSIYEMLVSISVLILVLVKV